MKENTQELRCPNNCGGKEFKVEENIDKSHIIVDNKANIVAGKQEITYRCLKCQKLFSSNIIPKNKKLLLD